MPQPFAAQVDAAKVATTREQRAAETRNEDVRSAVVLIVAGQPDKALSLLKLSVWAQACLLGLADTMTLRVSS